MQPGDIVWDKWTRLYGTVVAGAQGDGRTAVKLDEDITSVRTSDLVYVTWW